MSDDVEYWQSRLASRTAEWKQALHERDEYRHEVERLRGELSRATGDWPGWEGDAQATKAYVRQLQDEVERLRTAKASLNVTARNTSDEMAGLLADRDHLHHEVKRLRAEVEGYKTWNADLRNENERLRAGTDHANEDCVPKWEYERLRAQVGRLRKAVTWLMGALHEETHERDIIIPDCMEWECQRARVVLDDTANRPEPKGDGYGIPNEDQLHGEYGG